MSINKAIVAGNVCRDVDERATGTGVPVMEFGIAVNEYRKSSATGETEEYANFIDCTMFGERAGKLAKVVKKGMKVVVIGRLHQDRWEDRESGKSRSKVQIIVDDIELMQKRKADDEAQLYDADIPF